MRNQIYVSVCGSAAGIVCMMLSQFVLPTLSSLFAAAIHSLTAHGNGDKDKKREAAKQTYSARDMSC